MLDDIMQISTLILIAVLFTLAIFFRINTDEAYKKGYTTSLVNQEKGLPHDFILEEQHDGTWKWIKNSKGDFYKTTKKEHGK